MGKITATDINKYIALPHTLNHTTIANVIKQWFMKNGLIDGSRYVETKNGLRVHFTGISEWHFAKDVVDSNYKSIALNAICYLPEVFESGQYTAVQSLTKDRSKKRAKFVKFHLFKKTVRIGNYRVTIRAKAGEYPNGKIVLLPKLSAYTFYLAKVKEYQQKESVADFHIPNHSNKRGHATTPKISREPKSATPDYDSVDLDDIQEDLATFEILAIEEIEAKTEGQFAFDGWLDSWLR